MSGPTDVLDQRRAGQEEPFSVPQLPPLALHWQSIKAPMPSFTPARVDEEPHPPFRRPAVPAHMMPSCSAPTASATVPQAAVSLQDIMDKLRQQDERIAKMELSLKNKLVEIAQAQSKHMTKKIDDGASHVKAAVLQQSDAVRKYTKAVAEALAANFQSV